VEIGIRDERDIRASPKQLTHNLVQQTSSRSYRERISVIKKSFTARGGAAYRLVKRYHKRVITKKTLVVFSFFNMGSVPRDREATIDYQRWSYKLHPGLARNRKLRTIPYI
jgi:hypothetical protein